MWNTGQADGESEIGSSYQAVRVLGLRLQEHQARSIVPADACFVLCRQRADENPGPPYGLPVQSHRVSSRDLPGLVDDQTWTLRPDCVVFWALSALRGKVANDQPWQDVER